MNIIDWFRRRQTLFANAVEDFTRVARDQYLPFDYRRPATPRARRVKGRSSRKLAKKYRAIQRSERRGQFSKNKP